MSWDALFSLQGHGPYLLGAYGEMCIRDRPWAVCAFGAQENACVTTAAAFGGHMRVGFENNLKLRDGAVAAGNAELVRQAVEGARALGRPLADAAEALSLIHI